MKKARTRHDDVEALERKIEALAKKHGPFSRDLFLRSLIHAGESPVDLDKLAKACAKEFRASVKAHIRNIQTEFGKRLEAWAIANGYVANPKRRRASRKGKR
jgi:hypothetical protein